MIDWALSQEGTVDLTYINQKLNIPHNQAHEYKLNNYFN